MNSLVHCNYLKAWNKTIAIARPTFYKRRNMHEQTSSAHMRWANRRACDCTGNPSSSNKAFFIRNCAQSAPVAVAIISRCKSNYDQFGFVRIRTNIKRFALKFGARCMGCVPISRVERFVCLFEFTMTFVVYIFKRKCSLFIIIIISL